MIESFVRDDIIGHLHHYSLVDFPAKVSWPAAVGTFSARNWFHAVGQHIPNRIFLSVANIFDSCHRMFFSLRNRLRRDHLTTCTNFARPTTLRFVDVPIITALTCGTALACVLVFCKQQLRVRRVFFVVRRLLITFWLVMCEIVCISLSWYRVTWIVVIKARVGFHCCNDKFHTKGNFDVQKTWFTWCFLLRRFKQSNFPLDLNKSWNFWLFRCISIHCKHDTTRL